MSVIVCAMFQFQSGSIKRHLKKHERLKIIRFQFQSGSIKRILIGILSIYLKCFNSKVVRLKASFALSGFTILSLFQFQSGSIKSGKHNRLEGTRQCFNSKVVRLKELEVFQTNYPKPVSIPKWFD